MSKPTRVCAATARWPLAVVACSVLLAACDGDERSESAKKPPSTPDLKINVAANDPSTASPFDATPSPNGETVYYTALTQDSEGAKVPGIFKVPAAGGAIETLVTGTLIEAPTNISIGMDGNVLYVADPGASAGGAVLSVSAAGGAVSEVAGTSGYSPAGIVVARVNDQERIYFTGFDPATRTSGLYTVSPSGGDVAVVAQGEPFADPGGVVVTAAGDAYVADGLAGGGFASVIKVSGGQATQFIGGIGVGFPAGITTTHDDSTLVVSGLDPVTRRDVVYFVEIATQKVSVLKDPVNAFHESAGLHRAHETNVFAWADSEANGSGTVYVLQP